MSKVLRGDRNQCQGCKEYFNSTSAFDKHRVGEFGKDRRCRTTKEMTEIGMALNRDGFWVSRLFDEVPFAGERCVSRNGLNGEVIPKAGYDQKTPEIEGGER